MVTTYLAHSDLSLAGIYTHSHDDSNTYVHVTIRSNALQWPFCFQCSIHPYILVVQESPGTSLSPSPFFPSIYPPTILVYHHIIHLHLFSLLVLRLPFTTLILWAQCISYSGPPHWGMAFWKLPLPPLWPWPLMECLSPPHHFVPILELIFPLLLALCFFSVGLGSCWILLGELLYSIHFSLGTTQHSLLLNNHSSHFVWCSSFMNSLYPIPILHPICSLAFPPSPTYLLSLIIAISPSFPPFPPDIFSPLHHT